MERIGPTVLALMVMLLTVTPAASAAVTMSAPGIGGTATPDAPTLGPSTQHDQCSPHDWHLHCAYSTVKDTVNDLLP